MSKTCLIIAGPTAVGKTAIAIELAKQLGAEIISSDSRQCYAELNIGVAKPSLQQLTEIPHHFISSHSIHNAQTAADFETFALKTTNDLFKKSDTVVMVGGTGLYIKAFTDGLDDIPTPHEEIRRDIKNQYKQHGIDWLQREVEEKDPLYFLHGEMHNPHRIMRALEVIEMSGCSILTFRSGNKKPRPFKIIKVGLELPRTELYENINNRTDEMMDAGLLREAEELFPYRDLPALQTVGYRELFNHMEGHIDLYKAVERIKQNTRHYAKRQLTWFKKDPEFTWFPPGHIVEISAAISKSLRASPSLRL